MSGPSAKAWLFDLDGTLVHTAPELSLALNQMLIELGHAPVDEALATAWIGHGTRNLVAQALAHAAASQRTPAQSDGHLSSALARFDQHYRACVGSRCHLYPEVRETLGALRQRGGRLALVTNKDRCYTERILDALALREPFDWVISGDTLPTRKPDPAGVHWCLERWALAPQQAVFVGDSDIDAQTARRAGLPVYLTSYGYNRGLDVRESRPDRVLEHFSQILI